MEFKRFIESNKRNELVEDQFYQHLLSRALSEVEVMSEGELNEAYKVFQMKQQPEARSDHPSYDKRKSTSLYGTPVEDTEATQKNIAKHAAETGKAPSKSHINNHLKVFVHDTNPKTAGGVMGIHRVYGKADEQPISDEDRKTEAESNFHKFRNMSEADYKKKKKEVNDRRKNAKVSDPLKDTTKGDTIKDHPGDGEHEKNGHISYGFSGSPDTRRHIVNDQGDHVEYNACHGKGNCVHDCLAKGGCGSFESVKGHRDVSEQMNSHNASARHDHDFKIFDQVKEASKKAKKEGKSVAVRPDTATGHQAYTHAKAIADSFGHGSEHHAAGKGNAVKVGTYTKAYGTDKDAHDMHRDNINTAMSDQGVPTSKAAIKAHKLLTDKMRTKGKDSRIAFTVLKSKHPKTDAGMSDDDFVKHAKHSNPADQADYEKAKSVHTVRRYDLDHSKPGQHPHDTSDKHEYHDEKNKVGRVSHEGKSYFYSDHEVPKPMKRTDGGSHPTYMHDNRHGELTRHHKENPEGHGINAIAMATSSTKIHSAQVGKSIFHPVENVDNHGTLHVMHPASHEAENARNIMDKKD